MIKLPTNLHYQPNLTVERMFSSFLTESFQSYSLVSVLAVFVVVWLFVLRPDNANKEQTQVSRREGSSNLFGLTITLVQSRKGG